MDAIINSKNVKKTFQRKDLKVNLGKTKVMVSGRITTDRLSNSKVDLCGSSA